MPISILQRVVYKMSIKISIIIPVYNCEKSIKKCIGSICQQTLKEIEIIVVNDGSTDNTNKVIKEYQKKDNRIKILEQKNLGPSAARNRGIKIAQGKYVGFVDSDDYIEKNMYEYLYSVSNKVSADIGICNYLEESGNGRVLSETKNNLPDRKVLNKEEIKEKILKSFIEEENQGFFALWNKIYLKDFVIRNELELDEKREHGEDWLFNIQAFDFAERVVALENTLYHYVQINSNSLMRKYRKNQIELLFSGRERLNQILLKNQIDLDKEEYYRKFLYNFYSYAVKEIINNVETSNIRLKEYLKNPLLVEAATKVKHVSIHMKILAYFVKKQKNRVAILYLRVLVKVRRKK